MLGARRCAGPPPSHTVVTLEDLRARLVDGAAELGLALTEVQISQLLDYMALLQKWNKVYNLTAVRTPAEMLTHHLLDSLAVITPLRKRLASEPSSRSPVRLLDVGAGAGLPGVVIAICCPDIHVDCVDTVAKKAAFVQQTAVALRLANLRGLHARVESLTGPAGEYDLVCSRAFASLADFTNWSSGALQEQGVWMAMKGKHPTEELATLPPEVDVFHVEPLVVPGLDAERCLVWMRSKAESTKT